MTDFEPPVGFRDWVELNIVKTEHGWQPVGEPEHEAETKWGAVEAKARTEQEATDAE
jgi:hypothetical protein